MPAIMDSKIAMSLTVFLLLVCQVPGHPVDGGGEPPLSSKGETLSWIPALGTISESVWVIGASVCFALTVAIVASLGCLCCHSEGIKLLGARNGVSVPHLPLGSMGQRSSLSPEVTIFPPAAAAPHMAFASSPTPFDEKVSFEPLPKIFPRLPASPSKHPLRPAHYSGELGSSSSSVHNWFDDPQANFPRERLQYLQELGVGWFGQAVRGEAQNLHSGPNESEQAAAAATTTPVVVKILRSDATPTEHICFLHEVQHLRLLRHPNLLQLLGRCLESGPFLLILEDSVMDLKAFVLSKRPDVESFLLGPVPLQAACAIASALDHMHQHSFVHVDLAARSCVVDRNQTVKVGDYGTSLQAYKEDYHLVGEVAIPLRWSAPESLHCTDLALEAREPTKEANVWSFGVLLWELLSLGALPYEGLSDDEVLKRVVVQRSLVPSRPTMPAGRHTDRLYQVATWCWSEVVNDRPSMHEVRDLLGHLQRENSDAHDFELRWATLWPKHVKEHNLAPNHPATLSLSRMGFESDFVAASLQNLRGSAEDLRMEPTGEEEEEELTSFHISEAIRDLDAILAAESGSTTVFVELPSESTQRQDSLGNESVDSRELNSLGFKKSASVEDLLREGPEKVAEMFRITVIDDVDASGSEPRSLGADSDIWRRLDDGPMTPGNGAMNGGVAASGAVSSNVGIWGSGAGDTVQVAEVERDNGQQNSAAGTATREDVSSGVAGQFGGGCTSAHSCFLPPPAANSVCGGTLSTNTPDVSSSANIAQGVVTDLLTPVLTCSQSGDYSETSTLAAAAAPEPTAKAGSNSSRDSASYVTAVESEESSCGLVPELLDRSASKSETMFLTAMPDCDDTSDCSEATLADDDGNFESPQVQCARMSTLRMDCPSPSMSPIPKCASWNMVDDIDESALSDLTTEEDEAGRGGSSFEDSLAITEDSFVGEMRRIANEAVAQHQQVMQNGPTVTHGHSCNGPVALEEGDISEEEGLVEYNLNDISSVLDDAEGQGALQSPQSAWPPLEYSPMCGEEEEILTVNTLTHEITVRPAGIILDGREVLAGMDEDGASPLEMPERQQRSRCADEFEDDAEDTDDTSSTGTSCTSTSGSFECLAQVEEEREEGSRAVNATVGGGAESPSTVRPHSLESSPNTQKRLSTWDRGATPTKSALKSATSRRQSASGKCSTSLRKTVSFHDVISSVHHYAADEEVLSSPSPSAPASALDYASLKDWEFPFCLDEEFPEANGGGGSSSSEDESPPRGQQRGSLHSLSLRPRITKLGSSFSTAPLYCIAALSSDDLPTTDEEDLRTEPSLAEELSEDLLINQRPPWDSSMSDLSNLDVSDDADSIRSDSPVVKLSPTASATTNHNINLNANNFCRPRHATCEDSNANSDSGMNSVPTLEH